ncbi:MULTISPECIES: DUF6191 domain-containing protein [Streptomyces]|uniref:DUF6191 domain-containing protein n=1 Tax=Streptomyces TaxID=1883 RepID=UPI00131975A9|nr:MULTISPECIES: DUF6191 domain-containing protein [Streptomyces]QGZ51167.1 hypothetical protein GPZ77_24755 [Streptomyces sp. QHH-9511]GGU00682.1 hypothetical protein GCM10010272_52050 [Streptomyces lateritius]
MFNLAEELFAPGRKHTDDERRRLALTREEPGDGDLSRGPIDLASGRVTIRVPGEGAHDDHRRSAADEMPADTPDTALTDTRPADAGPSEPGPSDSSDIPQVVSGK